jgi:AraC-like DNA-binding protein
MEEESVYKVLPGAGVVMGFQFSGKLYHSNHGQDIELTRSGVTGISDTYKIFKNSQRIGTVLVYFKDQGAATFFRTPIHELFHSSVSLDNFVLRSEVLLLEEQLCEAVAPADKIKVVERFLISQMKVTKPDMLVINALHLIYQRKGNIRITELSAQLNISQSPLEKRFRKIVGASPKKFASIVRFKNILRRDLDSPLTETGYDAGFYDQSHFIKEFKKFTGDTPEDYFKLK